MTEFEKSCTAIEEEINGKFLDKRMNNTALIESFIRLKRFRQAEQVSWCGTQLEFKAPADQSEAPKLFKANFCKNRLCSMCTWRRSMKIFGQVSQVMDVIQSDYEFIFLTLTVRNCSAAMLPATIDQLQEGFNRLMKTAPIRKAFKGYFKALEITHHPEYLRDVEYHPHLHLIVAVNKSYFTSRDYISHKNLIRYWQIACAVDYEPSVRIQKVKPKDEETKKKGEEVALQKAIKEVAKYSVKNSEVTRGSFDEIDRTVETYITALASRRLCSFGGIFKKTAKALKLDDLTEGDLVRTDIEHVRSDVAYMIIGYKWQIGYGYVREFIKEENKNDDAGTGDGVYEKLR